MSTVIELIDIHKTYHIGEHILHVLQGVNFTIKRGELISIMGASGSGKSTLMNIIGLLDHHESGTYLLDSKEVTKYTENELAAIRNKMIGFVFQSFFLLPRLSALQNVGLPLIYRGVTGKENKERSLAMLKKVGMEEYYDHKPSELSGGQMQRVAIARALVGNPSVILADEPTGALDSKIGQEVMDLFIDLNRSENATIVIITHDPLIAQQCQRIIHIRDGLII